MPETIKVKLPDGTEKQVAKGTTALDVAREISMRLADAALVARLRPLNDGAGQLVDLAKPIERDAEVRILTERDPEALEVYRHSTAHLLAAAVLDLFPETKLGHGPPTESGFFYDFYRPTPFTPEDLERIEKRMAELRDQDLPYAREFLPREEGLERFKGEGDWMKCHFIEQFTAPDEKISIYKTGKFLDFCRGPHIPSTGKIKAFKLLNIAGAYWLGKEGNPQLQRIYGTSFFSKKDLDQYLNQLEEAKKRDHRVLGKQLDLFSIQDLAGPGLVFWHPKGGIMRKLMEDWMREEYLRRGYSLVYTPHIVRRKLFEVSGHEVNYAENMFPIMEMDDADYRVKPMNCPGHILIYRDGLRSYRDLPMRLGEMGTVYRYERSGVMHGLLRVRGFTQDDAHIFCTPEQMEDEVVGCIDFALAVMKTYGFEQYQVELSTWDPGDRSHYMGSDGQWETANQSLENALKRRNIEFKVMPGEAAFYGPKIDIKLVDAIGRPWQLSTVQFDWNLPERFQLEYVAQDGSRKRPMMVHRALYGSEERFFGTLIEHYAGAFPAWLCPVQAVVIPIAERHAEYGNQVANALRAIGGRVEVDARNEKMNAKIREHALQKIPFLLVVGDKEAAAGAVNVRTRGKDKTEDMPLDAFVARMKALIESKAARL
jgi:threonyl-tRNA synthetase